MTLKEKITKIALDMPLINSPTKKEISDHENGLSNLEQIADEFAIGFAEWTSYKYKYLETKGWFTSSYDLEMGIFKSSKQLLEIYKKEIEKL